MTASTRRTNRFDKSSSSSSSKASSAILAMLVSSMFFAFFQTVATKQRGVAQAAAVAFHHHQFHKALLITKQHHNQRIQRSFAAASIRLFTTTTKPSEDSSSTAATPAAVSNDRLSSKDLVLDLRCITQELPTVLSHLKARHASAETIASAHEIVSLAERRSTLIQERDAYLNQRKVASATVGQCNARLSDTKKLNLSAQERDEIQIQLDAAKQTSTLAANGASVAEEQLRDIQTTLDNLLAGIPNLLDDIVPFGKDDQDNVIVSTWGDISALPKRFGWYYNDNDNDKYSFVPKWHDDVAIGLNGYRIEQAVQMSGTRFIALSGVVAQLERALAMFFMDLHTTQHDYIEMSVPFIVARQALMGTSQLPKFENDLFAITQKSHTCNGQDAFLIPTAEVPVTNLHANQILDEDQLPISYVACTPCFRAEAGSYGRDTKGLIRTHQFIKVELVKITTPESSNTQHELLTSHAEKCLQQLELPYRKVRLCSGDVGFAAKHCYDLEVWLPGANEYREISSCSNCGDFQSRRMSLKYRPNSSTVTTSENDDSTTGKKKKSSSQPQKVKPVYCHTINGSGLAVGRALVAVLENYQKPDGSVVVPKVLQSYMGGKEIILPPSSS